MNLPARLERRTRALLFLAAFLAYYAGMEIFVRRLAILLAPAEWFSVLYQALRFFLALAGVAILARFWNAPAEPSGPDESQVPPMVRAAGWQWASGAGVRLAEGAALGWGIVLCLVLPVVITGGLRAYFDISAAAWSRFALIVLATALGAALRQTTLAGLPLRWLGSASSSAFAVTLMAGFAALTQVQGGHANWAALSSAALFQALCCIAALRTGSLWMGWGLDFSARLALGGVFGFPVLGSSLYSSPVLANSVAPAWLSGAEFGPAAGMLAPLVLAVALVVLLRMTPIDVIANIRPAGMPVVLEGHHAKGFGDPAPAGESLVQIAPPEPPYPTSEK